MSPRARRVMLPAMVLTLLSFVTFLVHLLWLGTSAFPGGHVENGRYLVEDHGKLIELTASQYWLSYVHGVFVVLCFIVFFVLVIGLYAAGDLRDEAVQ